MEDESVHYFCGPCWGIQSKSVNRYVPKGPWRPSLCDQFGVLSGCYLSIAGIGLWGCQGAFDILKNGPRAIMGSKCRKGIRVTVASPTILGLESANSISVLTVKSPSLIESGLDTCLVYATFPALLP